jgi:MFS transporter, CP family, cyanate transporter
MASPAVSGPTPAGVPVVIAGLLTRRLGLHRLLSLAMLVLAAGIVLWLVPGVAALFGGSLVAGAGIGIGIANIVMPGMIKRDFAPRAHLVTGLYTTTLFVSGALAAGVTVPQLTAGLHASRDRHVLACPAAIRADKQVAGRRSL